MNRNVMMAALAALSISFASAALGQDREPLPLPVTKPAQASQKNAPVVVRSESLEAARIDSVSSMRVAPTAQSTRRAGALRQQP